MTINIAKILQSEKLTKYAVGTAGTVYVTTGIKALGRPAFICADKHSDKETKKYTAGKEFLYQLICLGITIAMIPFFKAGGLKLASKYLKGIPEGEKVLADMSETKNIYKKLAIFKNAHKESNALGSESIYRKSMNLTHGGAETASFVGSILGLTIIAPEISHRILHPIMKAIGLDNKPKDVGQPKEVFLADAKVPTEKANTVNTVI